MLLVVKSYIYIFIDDLTFLKFDTTLLEVCVGHFLFSMMDVR